MLCGHSVQFLALNPTASIRELTSLTVSFNLAAALIHISWVLKPLIGIALNLTKPPPKPI
ncbi:CBU_0592 family membrane protein [Sulfitobacter sp. MF3-043]|uniref:CBU_0592 family membrane protein n=1 Tax=Sulfitobacter sediminivivens TaxID=3252902 RepID=UPI003EBCB5C7